MRVASLATRLAVLLAILIFGCFGASCANAAGPEPDLGDPCYAPQRSLTPALRTAFVAEVSTLALAAEKDHGVPAPMLAAMAIKESGYGTAILSLATILRRGKTSSINRC